LRIAFVVLSAAAMAAIVFTGRYPRAIFEFNVGVLRWTWRVQYYRPCADGCCRRAPGDQRQSSVLEVTGFLDAALRPRR